MTRRRPQSPRAKARLKARGVLRSTLNPDDLRFDTFARTTDTIARVLSDAGRLVEEQPPVHPTAQSDKTAPYAWAQWHIPQTNRESDNTVIVSINNLSDAPSVSLHTPDGVAIIDPDTADAVAAAIIAAGERAREYRRARGTANTAVPTHEVHPAPTGAGQERK